MPLITFRPSEFSADITIDSDFKSAVLFMNSMALRLNLKIKVNESIRYVGKPVPGAIVKPAGHSCHFVGHALDINLIDAAGKVYDHVAMQALGTSATKGHPVTQFIQIWKLTGYYRWGGTFGGCDHPEKNDAVHFDDGLYIRDKKTYQLKFDEYQNKK